MQDRYELPETYIQAAFNLAKGHHSLGFDLSPEQKRDYPRNNNLLERIVVDLATFKNIYNQLLVDKTVEMNQIAEFKGSIRSLRTVILDAITTLSDVQLLAVSFDTGRYNRISLLAYLAEIGEVSLFKAAFIKLQPKLFEDDLRTIFQVLNQSYEGSRLSESLGLASSTLERGNVCYPVMVEWMLNSLRAKGVEFLPHLQTKLNYDSEKLIKSANERLASRAIDVETFKNSAWQNLSREQAQESDEALVKAAAEVRYHKFVTEPKGEHLFLKAVNNFFLSANPIYEETSSDFLLKVLASKELKIAALVIIFIGFVIGSCGVGAAVASVGAGLGIAIAGYAVMGLGLGTCGAGFFASSRKDPVQEFERVEDNFYTGVSL